MRNLVYAAVMLLMLLWMFGEFYEGSQKKGVMVASFPGYKCIKVEVIK